MSRILQTFTPTKATPEELAELHRLVVLALLDRLDPVGARKPSLGFVGVAGALLRGEFFCPPGVRRRRELELLYRRYCQALLRAMEEPRPSAGVLGEARAFLQSQGITKALTTAAADKSLKASVQDLAGLDLPFDKFH